MNKLLTPGLAVVVAVLFEITAAHAQSSLAEAVKERNKEAVSSLLKQRVDVNGRQADGATALHWAAHWDDLETAELLIRAGANVNALNDYGVSPLWLACTNGNAAMVENLLKADANPNSSMPNGETALMMCARTGNAEAVQSLLTRKPNVNAKENDKGQTALMWAVAQKHAAAAQVLIEHGADIHLRSKSGFTPLLFAARNGDVESARVLLAAGANVNEAIQLQGNPGEVPTGGMTPLLMASASGHEALSIFQLDKGADPNAWDGGAAPLHYAFLKGIVSIGVNFGNQVSYLFRPNMRELVKALLAHGANPNVRLVRSGVSGSGRGSADATPFMLAAAASDAEMMRLLVASGANPLLVTKSNLTPIMAAAGVGRQQDFFAQENDALEAVRLAVELGGDVNAATEEGLTAMHGAVNSGANSIISFLVEKGARVDARDKYQQTPLTIASAVRLPWVPKGNLLGEVVRTSTADLLLKLGATPLTAPGYFTPVEDSEVFRMNPKLPIPGAR